MVNELALGTLDATHRDSAAQTEPACRICLGGGEEERDLGRLMSPCRCSGSMRYVHVKCLNEWRGTGTNSKAYMECQQCKYQYRLSRTWIATLSHPLIILTVSSLFLLAITYTLGKIYLFILRATSIFPFPAPSPVPRTWTPFTGIHFRFAPLGKHLVDQPWHDPSSKDWYIQISGIGIGILDLILATNVTTVELIAFLETTRPRIPFETLSACLLGSSVIGTCFIASKSLQHPPLIFGNTLLSFLVPFKGGLLLWLRQGVGALTVIHHLRTVQGDVVKEEAVLSIVSGQYWAVGRLGLVGLVVVVGMGWGLIDLRQVIERWTR